MFIPYPVSRAEKIPDPGSGSASKNSSILTLKTVSKLSFQKKLSGMFIPDPDPSHIPDRGGKKKLDPGSDPQRWILQVMYSRCLSVVTIKCAFLWQQKDLFL
jgi:hypothetical protein